MTSESSYRPRYGAAYPSLVDSVVLITGGGSGIGEEIVRQFARQGSKVGFIDIIEEPSRALVAELEAEGHTVVFEKADLTDIDATRAAIEVIRAKLGPIAMLVNNAAHDQRATIDEITPEFWDSRQAVNLKHQFFCAQAVYKDMAELGGGSIVNVGSFAYIAGVEGLTPYLAAKSGVIGLTRGLARELGPHNIRVNCVLPGWIMTQRQLDLWVTPEVEQAIFTRQCLKRKIYPADIARVIMFFASDESGACTNQSYVADGGWT
ncbi:SDR family NAD(P)-dependent oxidoreductase [Kaistia sp. MMO-174]|uniref:SDR family NAD(P)-dependent oxidoreductase n=1 Tax=Kaistia sp. MMO-174 TaxID=3081256 RepID=UPI0030192CA6